MKKKSILKITLAVFILLLIILLIHTTRNFIIIRKIQKNFSQYGESTNYHMQMKTVQKETPNSNVLIDYYMKDNKQLEIMQNNKDGEVAKISMYNNGERVDVFYDNSKGKTCQIGADTNIMQISIINYVETRGFWQTAFESMLAIIGKTSYNNKECYVVKNFIDPSILISNNEGENKTEAYIEKDTGLFVKLETSKAVMERSYEFDQVSDEIFAEPDISQYKLQNN